MTTEPMETLFDEVRHLWHVLVQAGERLHAEEPVTLGMRGVLELLRRTGPATVPAMARARSVSRQHVQALVNTLFDQGLVELVDNPAHKRSPLVRATAEGERVLARMRRREARLYGRADFQVSAAEVDRAVQVLRAVRSGLEEIT